MRKLTTAEFIERARQTHGSRYDYGLTHYVDSKTKLTVVCSVHGPFEQSPGNHMQGMGCLKCGLLNAGQYHKKDTDKFIEHARAIHGLRYDYAITQYRGAREKLKITCHHHGPFEQVAFSHLRTSAKKSASGCPACSYEDRGQRASMTMQQFQHRAYGVHGQTYDYSLVEDNFEDASSKVQIICSVHGKFEQAVFNHLSGQGCPVCGYARGAQSLLKSSETFIAEAHQVHKNRYDYSQAHYSGAFENVTIICPLDGAFQQSPTSHLSGIGCPKCGRRGQGAPRNITRALRGEFDDSKAAFVYMLTITLPDLPTTLYKVGSGTGSRLKTLRNDIKKIGGKVVNEWVKSFCSTAQAIVFEQLAHRQVKPFQFVIPAHLKFPGYSEVFSIAPDFDLVESDELFKRFLDGHRWS